MWKDLPRTIAACAKGSIPVMTAFMLLPMVIVSGGAIDLVAYERMRARMQDSLDRGVLAAASLTQASEAREVVDSFVRPAMLADSFTLAVDEERATNARKVAATLTAQMDTSFLRLVGLDQMAAEVRSAAEERRNNIEISLILDVSGSMRFAVSRRDPNAASRMRIDHLRPAAKTFLDIVLDDEAKDYTTVSIVPYAGQVSVGKAAFDLLMGGRRIHNRSSCIELINSDYTLGISDFRDRNQTQHFTNVNHHERLDDGSRRSTEPWWCPDDPHGQIAPEEPDYIYYESQDPDDTSIAYLSNDRERLKRHIDQMKLYDGTGTPIALKWGALLLDPAIQPMIAEAVRHSATREALRLDPAVADRPAGYDDQETLKFVVLMTDGAISSQRRPRDQTKPIYYVRDPDNRDALGGRESEARFLSLCEELKSKDVEIFTIGFEVSPEGADQMAKCATRPANFYRVEGLDIDSAFRSIASAIQAIKLIG